VTRRIHIIGIGAGDPDYVTAQAVSALNDTDVFFVVDKGEAKSALVAWRREICARFIDPARSYRFVELPDPPRAGTADYRAAVTDWHTARTQLWSEAIANELGPGEVGAFLAWGDPSLYDSTLRILEVVGRHLDVDYDVIPGITAVERSIQAGMTVDPGCAGLLAEIPDYTWKRERSTGAEKEEPVDVGDDACDALRYGVMGLDRGTPGLLAHYRAQAAARAAAAAAAKGASA